jgi:hypothetical protein
MISLILPYFNRQQAANKALELIGVMYHDLDLEVIVVDDGSKPPFNPPLYSPLESTLSFNVIRLPEKEVAQASCTPMNAGVRGSYGDILAFSSVEMLHHKPILAQMRDELLKGDANTYVSAAVWCPSQNRWHAHSSLNKPPLHFMTMLKRDLWNRSGGFDEDYREGMCFDDNDFVNRLLRAGMHYVYRDDLVVEHPRAGAKAKYMLHQHERNRRLYESKWA